MPTGTVKWFNPARGFGIIGPDDGSVDVYVKYAHRHREMVQSG